MNTDNDITPPTPTLDHRGKFAKGNQMQPRGNERAPSLIIALKRRLREHPNETDAVARELVRLALKKGSMFQLAAIKEVFDRIDGRAVETIEHKGELPITLQFVPATRLLPEPAPALEAGVIDQTPELVTSPELVT